MANLPLGISRLDSWPGLNLFSQGLFVREMVAGRSTTAEGRPQLEFREAQSRYPTQALQRQGVRVTVVSTLVARPPMSCDVELTEVRSQISRD